MKSLMQDQYDYGFSRSGYWDRVCRYCIADDCLAEYASQGDLIEECRFCGRSDTSGVLVDDLFRHMVRCLRAEWDDPIQGAAWEGGYIGVQLVDSDDLLSYVGEPLGNEDLREEFISAFDHDWCSLPFYGSDEAERLIYGWETFSKTTKTHRRYLVDRTAPQSDQTYDDRVQPHEMLDALGSAISQVSNRMLGQTADIRIVRARVHDQSQVFEMVAQLGPPPSRAATHNRMSAAGVSVFYGAESEVTALKEVLRCKHVDITTSCWTPSRDLIYLDLLAAEPIPCIFDAEARFDRQVLRFMASFAEDLARPVSKEAAQIDYVPTQIATEYIRDYLLDGVIDAIRYPSAVDPDGVCWVVFTDDVECQGPDPLLVLDAGSVRRYEPGE